MTTQNGVLSESRGGLGSFAKVSRNRCAWRAGAWVVFAIGTAPLYAAQPASQPTTRPSIAAPATQSTRPTTGPSPVASLPDDFAILKTRNAFAHGKPAGPQAAKGPESTLVFRGAVDAGGQLVAFVEDMGSKRVMELNSGAAVARGRVKSVDLDALVYESGGNSKRIEVGQNLSGEVVPPTPTSKPAGPKPPNPGEAPPPSPGGPPGPSPGAAPPARNAGQASRVVTRSG